jgi:hypothetical protein
MGFQELLKIVGLELPFVITPKDLDFLSYLVFYKSHKLFELLKAFCFVP